MTYRAKARIISLGVYLPESVLTNEDLEKSVDTTDEWIVSRTGIRERRIAAHDEFPSEMGAFAAKRALEKCGVSAESVDLILLATMTSDYTSSSTAAIIQSSIGATRAAAMDLQAACSGFIYGLKTAKAFIESGQYETVLLIASEKMSSYVNYQDRNTCILFGDGAAAAVITNRGKGLSIDSACLGADGSLAHLLRVPAGGSRVPATSVSVESGLHFLQMEGRELFKHAVRRMVAAAEECLQLSGLKSQEIRWIVPHQANMRIIEAIAKGMECPMEQVYCTLHKYGNTSASSVGIALEELWETHTLSSGDHLLLVAFGAGLTWGAVILTVEN